VKAAGSGEPGFEVDAESWLRELLPELPAEEAARLGPDRDILFEALVEFVREERPEGVEVRTEADEEGVAADAALLLPGVRIHVRAKPEAWPTLKDAVKVAVTYAVAGGDPVAGGVALSVDLGYRIIERATRLSTDELAIVMALLDLGRGEEGRPTSARVHAALPELEGVGERLDELAGKEVLAGGPDGWVVNF